LILKLKRKNLGNQNKGKIKMIDRRKIGKQNKRKGALAETESAKFWSKKLNSNIRRTPRSGAFIDWPGDLIDLGNSILKDFIVDIKSGKTAVPKKLEREMNKLKDEAQGKLYFLELSKPWGENYIIINRKHFGRLLYELQNYRKK